MGRMLLKNYWNAEFEYFLNKDNFQSEENLENSMGNNDINLLRVCLPIDMKLGYYKSEYNYKKLFDKLIPVLEDNNVKIGVQNHCVFML